MADIWKKLGKQVQGSKPLAGKSLRMEVVEGSSLAGCQLKMSLVSSMRLTYIRV